MVHGGLVVIWHLVTGCHLCSTPISGNTEDLSQYDPGC